MFGVSEFFVKSRKERYKPGMRVRLTHMDDFQAPPIGTEGTVRVVDDIGTIHVSWDNGSGLGVTDQDSCEIIDSKEVA